MTIGYLGTFLPQTGGAAISCTQLVQGLAERGHQLHVIAPADSDLAHHDAGVGADHPRVQIKRFSVPYFQVSPHLPIEPSYAETEWLGIIGALTELVETERLEALLVRETYVRYVIGIALAQRIRLIVLVRGNPTVAMLEGRYPADLSAQLITDFRKADRIIAVAGFIAAGLAGKGLRDTVAIRNAIDVETFVPRPKREAFLKSIDASSGDVIALHASQLKPLKRPLDIVRSASEALAAEPRLLYVIVGTGPCLDEMKKTAQQLGVHERFRLVGRIPHSEMPTYTAAADITIMPSETEGLSRMYLEAMASGSLLLASDIPAARELVVDGETGLLFRRGDVAGLTAVTVRAARDEVLRGRIARAARRVAVKHDLRIAVRRYEDSIREVVFRN